ncbi:MAG TPA: lanthionine synthetase LanC family protein [Phototrophicaceae bacterium]|nr:lanthionine synthetase LanC family protein [Phototrophicaceae bacterium]
MKITDRFIIASDVKLIEVAELPEWFRAQFEYEPGDYALTRAHSRALSQIIDEQAARLFQEFQAPKTISEAVLTFSRLNKLEPQTCLNDAFPWLQQAILEQFLVSADAPQTAVQPTYAVGDQIADYQVTRLVQFLDDTEVYEAVDGDGRNVAVKLMRSRQPTFDRELNALRHLDGSVNPCLLEAGEIDGRSYLVMEWCGGTDILSAAQQYREIGSDEAPKKLLALVVQLVSAYAHLHEQGVLHGDIHPRNVIVDAEAKLRIIDFGLAQPINGAAGAVFRGGMPSFFEPEYAAALLQNTPPPQSTMIGEVYALGALVYMVLTGMPYLNFSLEREPMLKQIVEDEPLSFAQRGLPSWTEVEPLVRQALSKEPSARFASAAAFAAALQRAQTDMTRLPRTKQPLLVLPQLEQDVLKRLSFDGDLVAHGLGTAPTTSFNYGAAGIAYACYRMACAKSDADLLALAVHWLAVAKQKMADDDAFYNSAMSLTPETVGRVSPYHSAAGVHAVSAYIAHALGDLAGLQAAIQSFVAVAQADCESLDLTLGRSGVALTCGLLLDLARTLPAVDVTALLSLGSAAAERIWSEVEGYAPIGAGNPIAYLGIAHGWAGILYAALRWSQASGWTLPNSTAQRLTELADLAEPVGQGARWAWSLAHPGSTMPGWCNGSAGHVHLWTLAYEMVGEKQHLELAQKAARNIIETRSGSGNLCCGLAGQAYALLKLHRQTGDHEWLSQARTLAEKAALAVLELRRQPLDQITALDLRPEGLYKGEVGVALLATEISQPDKAVMPLFERIDWS